MADIGIDYRAETSPARVNAQLGLQFIGSTLRATIRSFDNFVIKLTPSGNISEQDLSGAAWPIAQTLGVALPPLAHNLIVGHTFDITSIEPDAPVRRGRNRHDRGERSQRLQFQRNAVAQRQGRRLMSVINFDLSISPDPATLGFQATMDAKSATISLQPVDISISAKPSTGTIVGGAIAGAILGGFVGGGITARRGLRRRQGDRTCLDRQGQGRGEWRVSLSGRFRRADRFNFDVEGVQVHIEAARLALSTFNGMLMAEGTAKVT